MAEEIGSLRVGLSLDSAKFEQSMSSVDRNIKALGQDMAIVRAKGNEWGNSLEGLSVKQKTLSTLLESQDVKVRKLNDSYQKAVTEQGENSKAAENLAIKIKKATAEYTRTETELSQVNSDLNKQQAELNQTSKRWDGLAVSVDKTGDKLKAVGDKMKDVGGTLSAGVTAPLVAGFALVTKGTQEMSQDLARLNTNARAASIGTETINKAFLRLSGVSDEADSNVEALSNLLATGFDEQGLLQAMDALSGAVVKFPDTVKIEGLADGLQETLATGKAIGPFAEILERMGVDLEVFNEGLAKATKNGDQQNYVLKQLANTGLADVNKAYREQNENIVKANESQAELQISLTELGDKLRPLATMVTEFGIKGVDAFNNLTPAGQKTALTIAGIAAAAGPTLVIAGQLTTGLGSIAKVASPLIGTLGKAGLAGSFISLANPIGLTIAGITALTVAVGLGVKAYRESNDLNLEVLVSKQKEIEKNDNLIASYEGLRAKNQLSNEQMLRYLDIQAEIQKTSAPEKIAALKDEQARLLEKSTLTNDQMDEFLVLNQKVIDTAPSTVKAISSEGEAFALNTGALRELNAEKAKQLEQAAYETLTKALENERNLLKEQTELIDEINAKNVLQEQTKQSVSKFTREIKEQEALILDLEKQKNGASAEEIIQLDGKIRREQDILLEKSTQKQRAEELLITYGKQMSKRGELLETNRKEIALAEEAKFKYEEIILAQAGITAEKGRGLEKVSEEIAKLETQKTKLSELLSSGKINTAEYQTQNEKIGAQIGRLQTAKSELQLINDVAGKTVYKDVIISENPKNFWNTLDANLSRPISKTVSIRYNNMNGPQEPGYATGTRYAPGGLSWVGEKGPELMYLPTGARIVPNDDSQRLLNKWNIPSGSNNSSGGSVSKSVQTSIVQNFNAPILSPSEVARRTQQVQRQMALEWGY